MTDRLSFWFALAVAIVAAAALALAGPHWFAFVAALHVPAVLAALLLGRAAWRRAQGQPIVLQHAGRPVLASTSGVLVPALFLVGWTLSRESGVVTANLFAKWNESRRTNLWQPWTERELPPDARPGLVVAVPENVLGAAVLRELAALHSVDGRPLSGAVTLVCDPPGGAWPLCKRASVAARASVDLVLHPLEPGAPARARATQLDVEGVWTTIGFASRRDFHQQIGTELAGFVRDAIVEAARNEDR